MRSISDNLLNYILTYLKQEDNFVFLETSKTSAHNQTSFIFQKPIALLSHHNQADLRDFFKRAEGYLAQGFFLAGWFSYEFGYGLEPSLKRYLKNLPGDTTLARLGVFPPPITYNHATQKFSQEIKFKQPFDTRKSPPCQVVNLRPGITQESFVQAITKIKAYITAGDTYQVNYTLKYLFDFNGSSTELYKKLRLSQPVPYSAYLKLGDQKILSFSPELFFNKKNNLCHVKPMKGTMARGNTLPDDRKMANFLKMDAKNRSENIMIVDLLRNDLGRLCEMGSVKTSDMFDVETFASLHQMTTTVTGKLQPHTTLPGLFKALFPCGSVTGAPKIRTMEIINELETGPRGVYTGAIGYLAPNGDAAFNVPIRTIVLQDDRGEMGIGAGITHGSDPQDEWRESLLKGKFLSHPQSDFQLIETVLWQPGKEFWLLTQHLDRLQDSARYFSYPFTRMDLTRQLETLSEQWQQIHNTALRVRILLYRDGETSVNQTECDSPSLISLPNRSAADSHKLPLITISDVQTNPASPLLFHKTTRRDLYNRERERAVRNGFCEVIFCNNRNELTEGAISNIIIKQADSFYTPPQASGLLAGIGRAYLLEKHQEFLREKTLFPDDLKNAKAIYIVNSVRGVTEVRL